MHIAQALSTVQTLSPEVCKYLRVIVEVRDGGTLLYFWCQGYPTTLYTIELGAPDAKRILDGAMSSIHAHCCGRCSRYES